MKNKIKSSKGSHINKLYSSGKSQNSLIIPSSDYSIIKNTNKKNHLSFEITWPLRSFSLFIFYDFNNNY